jgi:asparagine synthetase B (glutamine-hydrolysing)
MSTPSPFFVLHRPAAPAPWPLAALRQRLRELPGPLPRDWHLVEAGALLLGWPAAAAPWPGPWPRCGDLVTPTASPTPALAAGEPEALARLDGSFAAVAFDPARQRAALVTDRFGLVPVYRHRQDGTTGYATSLRLLAALTRPECRPDPGAVYEMLGLGMVLGDRTFFRDIDLLPPASAVLLGPAGEEVVSYRDWRALTRGDPAPTADLVRPTYALIERAVLRAVAGRRRVAVALSGGLDSRLLAAVLARNGVPFTAYNVNLGRETPLAREVAKVLGVPLTVLPMLGEPGRSIPEAHAALDGCYHVNQTWGWEMARRAAADGCDLLLDGLAFDAVLGAVLGAEGDDPATLARGLAANYLELDPATVARLAGPAFAADLFGHLEAALAEAARTSLEQAGPLASDHFLMVNRVRKYTFGYCLANLHHLPNAFPYVTRELLEHCLRLPREERLRHNLYRRLYRELFPELARIPWAKTGLPLDRYGPAAGPGRCRQWADAVLRRLSRGRLGAFAGWSLDADLRRRRELRDLFARRLLGPSADVLPPGLSANAWRRHQAGRNHGGLLQALYTVQSALVSDASQKRCGGRFCEALTGGGVVG